MAKKTLMTEVELKTPDVDLRESTAMVESPGAALLAGQSGTAIDVDRSEFAGSPYVIFADPRSPAWVRCMGAIRDIQPGDPVLIPPEPLLPVRLTPFRFLLLAAQTYYCQCDSEGQIVRATREKNPEYPAKHVLATLLVFTPAGLCAATCTFKTTKTGACERAADALEIASKPVWPTLSPAHKETLNMPLPWQRFTTTVRLKAGTGRTSGNKYIAANGVIEPSDLSVWKEIQEFSRDKDRMKVLDAAYTNYRRRLADVEELYNA